MKALFLIFHRLAPHNGISKKIISQFNALLELGLEIELCHQSYSDNIHKRYVGDTLIKNYGGGIWGKIYKRIEYNTIVKYVLENNIKYIYARYDHNANPLTVRLFKKLRDAGTWIDLEIPTYPYDREYLQQGLKFKAELFIDKLFRRKLARYVNRIITFSDYGEIFGVKTLKISNGIDFESIKVKEAFNKEYNTLNLIGVADIHYWHGFDRMVAGMVNYYSGEMPVKVVFNIVGGGCKNELERIREIADKGKISSYVKFWGPKSGEELDKLFDVADFGVASLGRHRSGITKIRTLKTREYAARGIPFAYSEIDDDFENMPYVLKVPPDETPVDILSIVKFCADNKFTPAEIRSSVEMNLSWKAQMKRVVTVLNTGNGRG
ncbi:MAG: glycosyltransferase [Bacteroidales bacterium]|nr:glycosyltransferase [Bacteroidales bacterium]MDD3989166.1 glycosyltransferase [Bacteroidales bacterium]MDD4639307.1 glycosyltransferase [Bacteroidales bacterium]